MTTGSVSSQRSLGRAGLVALVGLFVAGLVLGSGDPFTLVSFIIYMLVGAFLVARRPENAVGWLLIGIAFAFIGTTISSSIDLEALARGKPALMDALNAWVASWAGLAAFVGYLALTIIFPTGRLPRTDGRRAGIVLLLLGVTCVALTAFAPMSGVLVDGGVSTVYVPNPVAILPDLPIWSILSLSEDGTIIVIVLLAIGVIRMLLRFRRSTGLERLQLRWLVAAIGCVVLGILAGLSLTVAFGEVLGGAVWIPVAIAYFTIPVAIGIAVMRYRLFEIDRIVSRTIAYAVVTVVLATVFGAIVLALSTVLARFGQNESIAVAASTLAVFALFQPVMRIVRQRVDRRFNRARYDADRTTADFADRLRDEVDTAAVIADLDGTVRTVMSPTILRVWLREAPR